MTKLVAHVSPLYLLIPLLCWHNAYL